MQKQKISNAQQTAQATKQSVQNQQKAQAQKNRQRRQNELRANELIGLIQLLVEAHLHYNPTTFAKESKKIYGHVDKIKSKATFANEHVL